MSYVVKDGDRLVLELGQASADREGRFINLQQLPSIMLGVLVPLIAATYLFPEILAHIRWPVWLMMMGMFATCILLFAYTVINPGRIHAVAVDRTARTVEVIWSNRVSTTSQLIPFHEVDELRLRHKYDLDGSVRFFAELVLRSQKPIVLPGSTSERELRPLRAAIGLG